MQIKIDSKVYDGTDVPVMIMFIKDEREQLTYMQPSGGVYDLLVGADTTDTKVKIGNTVYDGKDVPVMATFTEDEREQIMSMHLDATKYCLYPDTPEWIENDYKKITAWMKDI